MARAHFVNVRIAAPDGPRFVAAQVHNVIVGTTMRAVAVHGTTLSDYRSGRRLADLAGLLKDNRGITPANAAQIAVERLYAQHGAALTKALRAAPCLNSSR